MSKSHRVVIGYIDPSTRIAIEDKVFLVEQKKKKNDQEIWMGKHYFSRFDDLLRFYIRIYIKAESKKVPEGERTLLALLDRFAALESKIQEVGNSLQESWAKALERNAS